MTIGEHESAINTALARYRSAKTDAARWEASRELKDARAALSAMLAEGARTCPSCGNAPHGMRQPVGAGRTIIYLVEVGCVMCLGRRVRGPSASEAVAAWNALWDEP